MLTSRGALGIVHGMRKVSYLLLAAVLSFLTTASRAETATAAQPPAKAMEAAKAIAKITGVALSPLLGTSAVGAYEYFTAPKEKKDKLPWYARPHFWLPALLLVGVVAAKDSFGTVIPPGLKKPLDVAETIENKLSGLVAAGVFVPLVASIFGGSSGGATAGASHPIYLAGLATIDFSVLLNVLTVPLAMAAFVLVWLVGHVINVLILLNPFGAVDAALKACRTFLMGLVTATSFANPWAGAVLSAIVILIAYFLAGWSFRLTVFGGVYVWDFVTGRRRRFKPEPNANWIFTARKIEKTPIRTYGKLVRTDAGQLTFEYRPWLVMQSRTLTLPAGNYAVGRGLFYPELMLVEGEKTRTMFVMPPRYRTHEDEVAKIYGIRDVRDVGLLKGFKAIWRWLKNLFGVSVSSEPLAAG